MTNRRTWLFSVLVWVGAALATSCSHTPQKIGPAPALLKVRLQTSKGSVLLLVHRDWAPLGADRFYELLRIGFYDQNRFFRAVKGFIVQFGVNGDTKVNKDWSMMSFRDDPPKMSNKRGTITFATSGPDTRATQVFINLADNSSLDAQGFVPFGEVVDGMQYIDGLYMAYGDGPPEGTGPDQVILADNGNDYLEHYFPKLDYIKRALIEK